MFFELFIFLTIISLGLILLTVYTRRVMPLVIAFVFVILTGSMLLESGIRYQAGANYDSVTNQLTYVFNSLTTENDNSVALLANTYFYGSFVLPVIALGLLVSGRRGGKT